MKWINSIKGNSKMKKKSELIENSRERVRNSLQYLNIKRNQYSLNDQLFIITFLLISMGQSIGIGARTNIINVIVSVLAIPFFVWKLDRTQFDKRGLRICGCLIGYGIFASILSRDVVFLVNICILISAIGCKIKDCIKVIFWFRLCSMVAIILSSVLGVRENRVYYLQYGAEITDTVRNSLGYYHPNVFVYHFFVLVAMLLYAYWEEIKWYHFVIILGLISGVYFLTWSKTGTICTALLVVFLIILKYFKSVKYIFKWKIWKIIGVLVPFMSIVCMLLYGNTIFWIQKINQLLQGRFSLAYTFYKEYGVTLFGGDLSESLKIAGETIVIDNAYIRILFEYGIIGIILFSAGILIVSKYFYDSGKHNLLIMFLIFCLYGVSERGAIDFSLAFPYVFLGKAIFENEVKKYDS